MKPLVFWQDSLSPHQSSFLSEIGYICRQKHSQNTYLIYEKTKLDNRVKQGWVFSEPENIICKPSNTQDLNLVRSTLEANAIHIFSGFRSTPFLKAGLEAALKSGEICYIFAERPSLFGKFYWLKFFFYTYLSLRYNKKIKGIITFGQLGKKFYETLGFSKVFEFAYSVRVQEIDQITVQNLNTNKRIIFVGTPLKLKGLQTLLLALSDIDLTRWNLSVVTIDNTVKKYKNLCKRLKIQDKVTFIDPMPNNELRKMLCTFDLLVLPSIYDGWGTIVNESLHAGCPVIVSDRCGSNSIVKSDINGSVFRAKSVTDLRSKLLIELNLNRDRKKIANHAREILAPEELADYFLRIINAAEVQHIITPPWHID